MIPKQTAAIFVHILNPFGMAWLRRTNESNVDLNRNFIADGQYGGAPANYPDVDLFLSPKSGPADDFFLLKAIAMILRHGLTTLVQAVGGGQYEYPQGLFFGGRKLEEGLAKYHAFLKERLSAAQKVVAIDVHTGIGRFGRDSLLVDNSNYVSLRRTFGRQVTRSEPAHGLAYRIQGGLQNLLYNALPATDLSFMAQEFGTYNPIKVLHALREENRWHHYGEGTVNHAAKQRLKHTFCPSSESWRQRVLLRGRAVAERVLGVLRESGR